MPPFGLYAPELCVAAILREISGATSYLAVRWVFRPFTQLRRTICASAPRRASTRLSAGLALSAQRSPPFGPARGDCAHAPAARGFPAPRPALRLAPARGSSVRVSRRAEGGGAPRARPPPAQAAGLTPSQRPRLLFTFPSRYSIRYRAPARTEASARDAAALRAALSSSATVPARRRHRGRAVPADPLEGPRRRPRGPQQWARRVPPRSPLRGVAPLSAPGLTDMLKFGPSPGAPRGLRRSCRREAARAAAPRPPAGAFEHRCFASRESAPRAVPRSSSTPGPSDPRAALRARRVILPQVPLRQPCYDFSFLQAPGPAAALLAGAPVGRSDGRCVQRAGTQSARAAERAYGTFLVRGGVAAPGPDHARRSPVPRGTRCGAQCSTRAAQSVEGHHRPASAARSSGSSPALPRGGRLAR